MRAVLQRVKEAKIEVDGNVVGSISEGLLVYLGVGKDDSEKDV
ncbi:MAG: D-tyrosyl-tRNA(Tyr) deacylase, partial [Planctomycetota bacterium]